MAAPRRPDDNDVGKRGMLDFIQQLVGGIALGRVYGVIALGFVLIYKATEVVNFAQGDLMMLGGFFAFTFITQFGMNYWVGLPATVLAMAAFGALVERVVVRPILGYPQFSIVMVTIGLGFLLRSVAGMIWGTDDLQIATPFSGGVARFGALVLGDDKLSVIVVVETLSGFYLPEGFKDVAAYILLLVVLMVRPEGLFGLNLHKKV